MGATAIQTKELGKRYGSFWALENCNITVPEVVCRHWWAERGW